MKTDTACATCGTLMHQKPGRGRLRVYCSRACSPSRNYARKLSVKKKTFTCADCGTPMWQASHSLPQGQARCLPCRRSSPTLGHNRKTPCTECGSGSYGLRCRACEDARRQAGADPDVAERRRLLQRRRSARERQAPGLTRGQRQQLLTAWQRKGRGCAYCSGSAETMDHVIPLALGGTNYEGNLTPACKDCNTTKNDSLLIEWKHKKRSCHVRVLTVVLPKPDPKPKVCKVTFKPCRYCGQVFTARRSTQSRCPAHHGYLPRLTIKSCDVCGVEMQGHGARRYCSDECRKSTPAYKAQRARHHRKWAKTPAGRAARRRHEARRMARKRIAQVETLF